MNALQLCEKEGAKTEKEAKYKKIRKKYHKRRRR
jgi:hypothetical protein